MSDSEPETTANVQSLKDEKLDKILEQADNSDDTLYTARPTCIDELSVVTYREQLQAEGFCMETLKKRCSIGMNLAARELEITEIMRKNAVNQPDFDPRCFGRPLVWNNCDKTSKLFYNSKFVRG